MNNKKNKVLTAELALVATMVEIAIMGVFPQYRDAAMLLIVPFMIYAIAFVLSNK